MLSLNRRVDSNYANVLFRDRVMVNQYVICSRGVGTIQRNLHWPSLKRASTLLPPIAEQVAMVGFLDHAGRRIRKYIRAKQKLITLLEEQKQAIIHQAVTRGLDPNVRLKPSGVEWLGDVPEHWKVAQFRTLGRGFTNGTTAEQLAAGESDYLVSRIETISQGVINYARAGYLADDTTVRSYYLRNDDFLISHINSYAKVGNSARYRGERRLLHGMNLIRVTPLGSVVPGFLEHLLKSKLFIGGMQRACKPAINQVSVTTTAIKSIRLPVPPLSEQAEIAQWLDDATAGIQVAVGQASREIDLLREFRARLTADIVTGKFDVRAAAAALPDEPTDALDELELEPTDAADEKTDEVVSEEVAE